MPESPDFEQIALSLWSDGDGSNMAHILEQLRLVWNARGAADLAAVDNNLMTDDVGLKRAIRAIDR